MKELVELHEFTWDMVRGLPNSYYYSINKLDHKVIHKPGLSSIYQFNSVNEESSKFNELNDTSTYQYSRPGFTLNEWVPPPLKEVYRGRFTSDKPLVVVQNKYTVEWGTGVYNYFSLEVLDILFNLLKTRYSIVYIRPDGNSKGYFIDDNPIEKFLDYQFIKENHKDVILFNDLLEKYPDSDYNTLQFMIEASSERHITTSGGNACVASYFGGDVIIYDSPNGAGSGRGIWKTDSWLKLLSGANIYGVNDYVNLIDKVQKLWIS